MISHEKLIAMLQLQDTLNCKVHPEWRKQAYPWCRAIMVEGVEALDHYGWKWWKSQESNLRQVRLELVDIWHFILSRMLEECGGKYDWAADTMLLRLGTAPVPGRATLSKFDDLIGSAADGQVSLCAFQGLMHNLDLTWDKLYTLYVAKNVLNLLRQDHGYAAGTYIKTWNGVEDNVALEKIMAMKPDATPEQLRAKLEQVYASVKATQPV